MHNSVPCHCSQKVRNYLTIAMVKTLEWPLKGADLSLMKNVWVNLKKNVVDKQPPSANALIDSIKNGWMKISVEYCRNLISSNLRLIQNIGGHSKH